VESLRVAGMSLRTWDSKSRGTSCEAELVQCISDVNRREEAHPGKDRKLLDIDHRRSQLSSAVGSMGSPSSGFFRFLNALGKDIESEFRPRRNTKTPETRVV